MVMMGKEIQSLVLIMKLVLLHKAPKTSYFKATYIFNFGPKLFFSSIFSLR